VDQKRIEAPRPTFGGPISQQCVRSHFDNAAQIGGPAQSLVQSKDAKHHKIRQTLPMAGRGHAIRNSIVATALAALNAWPSQAETIDIVDDRGGSSGSYAARRAQYRRDGVHVRITGPCESECTMVIGHLNREHVCVTAEGRFGFRLADQPNRTATLWRSYPTDIKIWLSRNGGLTHQLVWMQAPEIYRFFRQCEDVPRYSSFSVVK
jgi:hypothetical protein